MTTSWKNRLAYSVGLTLLLYGPRLLELGPAAEGLPGVYLAALLMLVAVFGLTSLNDVLTQRLDPRPWYLDLPLTLGINLLAVAFLVRVALFAHTALYEVALEQLLRRSYGVRFLLAALLSVPYLRYLHYRERSARAERENLELREQEATAQLTALRQRMDPHFLFNSLNTISGAVRQGRQDASLRMIADLAERYRYLTRTASTSLVKVGEELEFVAGYARLLRHRYGERFSVRWEPALPLRSRHIPPLSLQLLVENAVKHNRIGPDSHLVVTVRAVEGEAIEVSNPLQPRGGSDGAGEGLANLRTRFRLLGGPEAEPRIVRTDSTFSVTLTTFAHARPDPGR